MTDSPKPAFWQTHRIVMALIGAVIVVICALFLRWDWLPKYLPLIGQGIWRTIWLLVVTSVLGFLLAIPLGLAQAAGPWYLAAPARGLSSPRAVARASGARRWPVHALPRRCAPRFRSSVARLAAPWSPASS